jgi:hypothetical protein
MKKINNAYVNIAIAVLGIIFIVASFMTAHVYNSTPVDVWFFPRTLPIAAWAGLALSSLGLIFYVTGHLKGKFVSLLVLLLVISVVLYTHGIHRFMYQNPVYVDTFSFMGETYYTVTTGHLGFGYAFETPGFEAFSSQLTLVTGLNLQVVFDYLPMAISFLLAMLVLYLAYLLTNKNFKVAITAFLLFSAFCYWTIDYNRQSFSLLLQFLTWALFCLSLTPKRNRLISIALIIAFVSLLYSHPSSSLSLIIGVFAFFVLLHLSGKKENTRYVGAVLILFLVLWSLKYVLSFSVSVESAARALVQDIQSLIFGDVGSNVHFLTSGYTSQYSMVVFIRFGLTVFEFLSGGAVCLYLIIRRRTKLEIEKLFLIAMFTAGAILNFHSLLSASWFERGFLYSVIPWSILMGSFFVAHGKIQLRKSSIFLLAARGVLLASAILVVATPFTLNATTPFMYPPTQDLVLTRFLVGTVNANSKVGFIGGLMEHNYYIVVLNRYDLYHDEHVLSSNINMISLHRGETTSSGLLKVATSYDLIATNFRAYIKSAFVEFDPPLPETMNTLRLQLLGLSENKSEYLLYNRIYVADDWHEIYCKVNR